jgi:hypothetical protein
MDFRELGLCGPGKECQERNPVWHEWGGSKANSLSRMFT